MLLFPTPAHLVAFYDPNFHSRSARFCNWQFDLHYDFAVRKPDEPKRIVAVCPNGSGKSKLILGPQAAWTAMSFFESITAVTSASAAQLDMQTMPAVRRLADLINRYHKAELYSTKAKEVMFNPNHSPIIPRKSDSEGTQEGFHPISPGGEFTILVDEGKSIPDDIYDGIAKWTGWTRRTDISSAGEPAGSFYRMVTSESLKPYIITYHQCPHISKADIDLILTQGGGPDSILARQALMSEFVSLAGTVVLTLDIVQRCIRMGRNNEIEHKPEDVNRCGLDLSGGGDETVLSVWNGNKQLAIEIIPSKETTFQVDQIISKCKQYGLNDPARRKADAGGGGKAILDLLAKAGWPFVRIYNQAKPMSRGRFNFGNRGTDMWFRFSRLVEDCSLILIDDSKQTMQLSTRKYKQKADSDKYILQPKPEAKAEGRPSPDRADSAVLALDGYALPEEQKDEKRKLLTGEELEQWADDLSYGKFTNAEKLDGTITLEQIVGLRTQPGKFRV